MLIVIWNIHDSADKTRSILEIITSEEAGKNELQ